MEPISRSSQFQAGNYTIIQHLKEDLLVIEMVSLIDRQPYSILYRNPTLPEELRQSFGSVYSLSEAIEKCRLSKTLETTDLAQIKLHLPSELKSRQVVLQLVQADPTKLSEKGSAAVINGLLQDQCSLITKIDLLTSELKRAESSKYQGVPLSIDEATPSYSNFSIQDRTLVHKKEDVWSSVWLQHPLPTKGKFQVSLELMTFTTKCLMFGLGVASLKKMQSSHSYQGSVMLCLSEGQTSLYEKCGRNKATRGIAFEEGDRITMKVDLENCTLSWWLGDIQIVWTRIQREHVDRQLHVKCEMFGNGDRVRFC